MESAIVVRSRLRLRHIVPFLAGLAGTCATLTVGGLGTAAVAIVATALLLRSFERDRRFRSPPRRVHRVGSTLCWDTDRGALRIERRDVLGCLAFDLAPSRSILAADTEQGLVILTASEDEARALLREWNVPRRLRVLPAKAWPLDLLLVLFRGSTAAFAGATMGTLLSFWAMTGSGHDNGNGWMTWVLLVWISCGLTATGALLSLVSFVVRRGVFGRGIVTEGHLPRDAFNPNEKAARAWNDFCQAAETSAADAIESARLEQERRRLNRERVAMIDSVTASQGAAGYRVASVDVPFLEDRRDDPDEAEETRETARRILERSPRR
jgi:hypothetical protein